MLLGLALVFSWMLTPGSVRIAYCVVGGTLVQLAPSSLIATTVISTR